MVKAEDDKGDLKKFHALKCISWLLMLLRRAPEYCHRFAHIAIYAIAMKLAFKHKGYIMLTTLQSPLQVRLTKLACGGCVLAAAIPHALLDGVSAHRFLHDMAAEYRKAAAAAATVHRSTGVAVVPAVPALPPLDCRRSHLFPSAASSQAHSAVMGSGTEAATDGVTSPRRMAVVPPLGPSAVVPAAGAGNAISGGSDSIASASSLAAAKAAATATMNNSGAALLAATGLQLQAPRAPVPSWREVGRAAVAAWRATAAENRRFPGALTDLRTVTLHLPRDQVCTYNTKLSRIFSLS